MFSNVIIRKFSFLSRFSQIESDSWFASKVARQTWIPYNIINNINKYDNNNHNIDSHNTSEAKTEINVDAIPRPPSAPSPPNRDERRKKER